MQRLGELGVVSACDLTTEACCAKIGELDDLACCIVTEVSQQAAPTVWRPRRVVQTLVRLTHGSPVPGCILTFSPRVVRLASSRRVSSRRVSSRRA